MNSQVLELEELLQEKETELKDARADIEENTNEEQGEEKQKEESENKEQEEEEAKKKEQDEKEAAKKEEEEAKKKEQKEIESAKEETDKEDDADEEVSANDWETEIENVLEDARPMEASVSQGLDGNFITLEGKAKDGFTNSQIGRNVKEDMVKILLTLKENNIDFEEVRISFYLPTVNAYGEEGQSNMALGVFDKETLDRLEEENEHHIAQTIDSIALQFSLDSQFVD